MLCATLCGVIYGSVALSAVENADTIYTGGPIITMNDAAPSAEALAVKNGKILVVGSKAKVLKTKGDSTKIIDLGGKALLPGFVDAHGHVFTGGIQALSANMLAPPDGEVKDIASLIQTLKDWTVANQATVDKIQVTVGFGYDDAMLAELRHPTREDLDQVSNDFPVIGDQHAHGDAHVGDCLCGAMTQLAAITASTGPN